MIYRAATHTGQEMNLHLVSVTVEFVYEVMNKFSGNGMHGYVASSMFINIEETVAYFEAKPRNTSHCTRDPRVYRRLVRWRNIHSRQNKDLPRQNFETRRNWEVCSKTTDILRQLAEVSIRRMTKATTTTGRTSPISVHVPARHPPAGPDQKASQPGSYGRCPERPVPRKTGIASVNCETIAWGYQQLLINRIHAVGSDWTTQ